MMLIGHAWPTTALALLAICATSCSKPYFSKEEAEAVVQAVGAERLTEAAELLRARAKKPNESVPSNRWPEAIERLKPESVLCDKDGVWVSKRTNFVEAEGLLIVFRGVKEPEERWGDPSIQRVGKGVYWFSFTG